MEREGCKVLAPYRLSSRREFFRLQLSEIIRSIECVLADAVTHTRD
jgi:hypothetical protein